MSRTLSMKKRGSAGNLEGLRTMRLQSEGSPDASHGRLIQSAGLCHRTGTPAGRIRRRRLQGEGHNSFDLLVGQGAAVFLAGVHLSKPSSPRAAKRLPLSPTRMRGHSQTLGHGCYLSPRCNRALSLSPQAKPLVGFAPSRPAFQLGFFFRVNDEFLFGSPCTHDPSRHSYPWPSVESYASRIMTRTLGFMLIISVHVFALSSELVSASRIFNGDTRPRPS